MIISIVLGLFQKQRDKGLNHKKKQYFFIN
jgi:hypothetical protein